jgi:hypothetical protein
MGTIAWQYGQVGDRNSTTPGRADVSTSVSKLLESRMTTFEGTDGVVPGMVGLELPPPPPHPPARSATTAAATTLRFTPLLLD